MGYYGYFKDNINYYDLSVHEEYERFVENLSSNIVTSITKKSDDNITNTKDIIEEYELHNINDKIINFNSLTAFEQGEILHNIKKDKPEKFVRFYNKMKIDKSRVSLRVKLYTFFLEFEEFRDTIKNLNIGVVSLIPSNNFSLRKEILTSINNKTLSQNRCEIENFINQRIFSDEEKILDNQLLYIKSALDERRFNKLSSTDQQRLLRHFNKIKNIIDKTGGK